MTEPSGNNDGIEIDSTANHDGERDSSKAAKLPEVPGTPDALLEWRRNIATSLQDAQFIAHRAGSVRDYHQPNQNTKTMGKAQTAEEIGRPEEHGISDPESLAMDVVGEMGERFGLHADQLFGKVFVAADDEHRVVEIGHLDPASGTNTNPYAHAWKAQFPETAEEAYRTYRDHVTTNPYVALYLTNNRVNNYYRLDGSYSPHLPVPPEVAEAKVLEVASTTTYSHNATARSGENRNTSVWSTEELPAFENVQPEEPELYEERFANATGMLAELRQELGDIEISTQATERFSGLFEAIAASVHDPRAREKIVNNLVAILKKGDADDQKAGRLRINGQLVTIGDVDILLPDFPSAGTILVELTGDKGRVEISPTLEDFLTEINKASEE